MKVALCLHGYAANAGGLQAAFAGNEYIKRKLLYDNDVDVFVHSWDLANESTIKFMYPLTDFVFEKQNNFDEELKKFDETWFNEKFNRNETMFKNNTIFRGLSFLYSRYRAVQIKNDYQKKHNVKYDCTFLGRFDLGTRGKEHPQKYYATNFNFLKDSDMSKLHCAYWDQFNHGFPDHWFYSNDENITTVADLYNSVFKYYQPSSDYVDSVLNGWIDSDEDDIFSNEMLRENKSKKLKEWSKWECVDNHKLYKWHFYQNNLHDNLCLVDITKDL